MVWDCWLYQKRMQWMIALSQLYHHRLAGFWILTMQSHCDFWLMQLLLNSARIVLAFVWSIIYYLVWTLWYWNVNIFFFFPFFLAQVCSIWFCHFTTWKWIFSLRRPLNDAKAHKKYKVSNASSHIFYCPLIIIRISW